MNYSLSTNPYDPESLMFAGVGKAWRGKNDRKALLQLLTTKHMIETLERFKWEGLPPEIPQDIIERILYFRGKGSFFKYNDKFWFLPFALKGTIDSYGRYETISPVLFTGQFSNVNKKSEESAFLPETASDHKFIVVYNLPQDAPDETDGIDEEAVVEKLAEPEFEPAIILTDQSLGVSQDIMPNASKVAVLLERLVNTLIMIELNNINGIQTYSLFVKDQAQKEAVEAEFNNYDDNILQGKRVTVIVGDTTVKPFEELTAAASISDSQRYWQSYQAWDNLRKEIIGVSNGGQHLKMEHSTTAETEMSSSSASSVMTNALRMRQDFSEIVNSYYGLNITVNAPEEEEEELLEEQGAQSEQIDEKASGGGE